LHGKSRAAPGENANYARDGGFAQDDDL